MLVDRIAEVQREHRYTAFTGVCPCGFRFDIRESHEAHVAERVAAELQLTEETERISLLDMPYSRHRWVTAWSEKS